MIPEYVIQQVRDAVNPVDFIGQYTQLKKTGKDYYGPCPLCSGKKFSLFFFLLNQLTNTFLCAFGFNSI